MSDEDFEKVVKETLSELPEEFKLQLDNVEIVIEEIAIAENGNPDPDLLGLYHGVPKTERNSYMELPDKISIYKQPILALSDNWEQTKNHIKQTVLHELGHHFGLSDDELDRIQC